MRVSGLLVPDVPLRPELPRVPGPVLVILQRPLPGHRLQPGHGSLPQKYPGQSKINSLNSNIQKYLGGKPFRYLMARFAETVS